MVTLIKKIKSLYNKEFKTKGSALVMVVLTMSIVAILGTSILFISMSSFTRSMADTNRQKAYEIATAVTDNIRSNMGSILSAYQTQLSESVQEASGSEPETKVKNSAEIPVEFDTENGSQSNIKVNGADVCVTLKPTACNEELECTAMLVSVKSKVSNQTEIISFSAHNVLIDLDYLKESLGNSFVITDDFGTEANPITCGQINGDLSIDVPEGESRTLNANIVHGITGSVFADGDLIVGAPNNLIKVQGNFYVDGNLYLRGVDVGQLLPSIFSNKCGTNEYYTKDGERRSATFNPETGIVNGGSYTIGEAMYDDKGRPMQVYFDDCVQEYYAKVLNTYVLRTGPNRKIGEAMYDAEGNPKPAYPVGGNIYVDGDIIFDRANINGLQSIIRGDIFCTGRVIIMPKGIGVNGGVMTEEPDDEDVLGEFEVDENDVFIGESLLDDFDADASIGLPADYAWFKNQYTYYDLNPDNSYREKYENGQNQNEFIRGFFENNKKFRNGQGAVNLINGAESVYRVANNKITKNRNSDEKAYNITSNVGELEISLPNNTEKRAVRIEGNMFICNDKNNDGIADDSFSLVDNGKVFNGMPTVVNYDKDTKRYFIDGLTVYLNDQIVSPKIFVNGNINLISSKIYNNKYNSKIGDEIKDEFDNIIKNAFSDDIFISNYVSNWNVADWVNNPYASDNWKRWKNYLYDARPTNVAGKFLPRYFSVDRMRHTSIGGWHKGYALQESPYEIEKHFVECDENEIPRKTPDGSFNIENQHLYNSDGTIDINCNISQKFDNYVALYTNKIHPYIHAFSSKLVDDSCIAPENYAKFTGTGSAVDGIFGSAYEAYDNTRPYKNSIYAMYLRTSMRNYENITIESTVTDVINEIRNEEFVDIKIQKIEEITHETVPINITHITDYNWYVLGGCAGAYMWYNNANGETVLEHSKIEKDQLSDTGAKNYIYELRKDYYFDFGNRDVVISSNWDFALTELLKTSRTTFRAYTGNDPNVGLNLYLRANTVQLEKVTFEVIGAGNLYIYLVSDTDLKAYAPGGAINDNGDTTDAKLGTYFISDSVNGGSVMIIGSGHNNIEIGRGGYMNGIVYVPDGSYKNISVNLLGLTSDGKSQNNNASVVANNISIVGNNVTLQYTAFDPEKVGFGGARFQFELGDDSSNIWVFGGYET